MRAFGIGSAKVREMIERMVARVVRRMVVACIVMA